jgi:hypothetical protein
MSDKYKNGKIYTIRYKNDDSLIYVGSTIQPLFKRWHQHKVCLNNEKNKEYHKLLYKKIRETNIEDWYIELYEEFSCESKEQLNQREGEVIRKIGTLNKLIAGRTKVEYVEDNKDKIKKWFIDNKDKILQKQKDYYLKNKETLKEYIKHYREINKDKLLQKKKEYYEANKEYKKEYNKKYYESHKTQQIQ